VLCLLLQCCTYQLVYVHAMQQAPVNPHTSVLELERHVRDWYIQLKMHQPLLLLIADICCCCYVWPVGANTMLQIVILLMLMLHSGDINTTVNSCYDGVSLLHAD
jgi:hypothetical protein